MNHFKGKQFKKNVIIVAVGYYLRYNLSYREVQELLYDSRFKTLQQNRLFYVAWSVRQLPLRQAQRFLQK